MRAVPLEAGRGHFVPPGTGAKHGCELPHWRWELNPGPWQEQVHLPAEHAHTHTAAF